jgi:hypothetical protein
MDGPITAVEEEGEETRAVLGGAATGCGAPEEAGGVLPRMGSGWVLTDSSFCLFHIGYTSLCWIEA